MQTPQLIAKMEGNWSGENTSALFEKLNKSPFNFNLTIVSFDKLTTSQRLEVVSNVLEHFITPRSPIDQHKVAVAENIVRGLKQLHFPDIRGNSNVLGGLEKGDQVTIFSILEFLSSNYEAHKMRGYLSRFLSPLKVPLEMQGCKRVNEIVQKHNGLRINFKRLHKRFCQLTKAFGEGSNDDLDIKINRLKKEKRALAERVKQLEIKGKQFNGFTDVYEGVSSLRKLTDDLNILKMESQSQIAAFENEKIRFLVAKSNMEMHSLVSQHIHAQNIVETLEEELSRLQKYYDDQAFICNKELSQDLKELLRLSEISSTLIPSDVKKSQFELNRTRKRLESVRDEVVLRNTGYESHPGLFDQVDRAIKNRIEIQTSLVKKRRELAKIKRKVARLTQLNLYMDKQSINSSSSLDIRELHSTDLRTRCLMNPSLTKPSSTGLGENIHDSDSEALDNLKRNEEMHKIQKLANNLKIKREELQVKTKKLDKLNAEYQMFSKSSVGNNHEEIPREKKETLENLIAKEESQISYQKRILKSLNNQIERAADEEKYRTGQTQLLPNYKTYGDLYANDLQEQIARISELEAKLETTRTNTRQGRRQGSYFESLNRLLLARLNSTDERIPEINANDNFTHHPQQSLNRSAQQLQSEPDILTVDSF